MLPDALLASNASNRAWYAAAISPGKPYASPKAMVAALRQIKSCSGRYSSAWRAYLMDPWHISPVRSQKGPDGGCPASNLHLCQGQAIDRALSAKRCWCAIGAGVKCLFGSLETLFSRILLAAGEQIPGVKDTEMWFGEYQLSRQLSQPALQFGVLTTLPERINVFLDQVRCPLEILGAQSMLYRLIDEPVLLVPLTGPAVQRWHLLRLGLAQSLAQQVGKEMVIAIPTPLLVQGDDEQIGAFQHFQGRLAVLAGRSSRCGLRCHAASHKEPVSRSRMAVCSKKVWTLSDCCSRTSSTR